MHQMPEKEKVEQKIIYMQSRKLPKSCEMQAIKMRSKRTEVRMCPGFLKCIQISHKNAKVIGANKSSIDDCYYKRSEGNK
jgi:hypothetical protein